MIYIKIVDSESNFVRAEEIPNPVYVKHQQVNNVLIQCPAHKSQGILSADGGTTYQLQGKEKIPGEYLTATEITKAEYELIKNDDPEDDNPAPPEDPTVEIMTRAELSQKIIQLEEVNEMLMACVLEMSETVYA